MTCFTGRSIQRIPTSSLWWLEAVSPEEMQEELWAVIESVLDLDAFRHEQEREKEDAAKLAAIRERVQSLLTQLDRGKRPLTKMGVYPNNWL
jgi:hypothetical protein